MWRMRLRVWPSAPRRLSGPAWWFIGGYGLSAVGTGLVYPFLAIYLSQFRGMSSHAAALLLLVLAGAAVPMSVSGGWLVDRYSARSVGLNGLLAQATGWLLLAAGHGYGLELLAMMVIGAGTGLFLPAVIPIIAVLSRTEADKARTQSLRYMMLNLGLGLGAALGGFVLGSASDTRFRWLFTANGASCALYALILTVRVRLPRATGAPMVGRSRLTRFRPGPDFVLLLAAQLLFVAFGLAQIESGVPLAMRADLGVSTGRVGMLYGLATLVVLVGQLPVSRLVERVHKTRALIGMGLSWAVAWLLGYLASMVGQHLQVGLLVVMMVTFALGECAYSPAFYTLVEKLVPASTLGRSSGATWATFQVGNTVGPSAAVFLVGGGLSLWLVLSATATIAALLMLIIDRRMHAHPPTPLPRPTQPPEPQPSPGHRTAPTSVLAINPAGQTV